MKGLPGGVAGTLLTVALTAAPAAAQNASARPADFGTAGTEFTEIGAGFRASASNVILLSSGAYMYPTTSPTWLVADLGLEDGLWLQNLRMFFYRATSAFDLTFSLCQSSSHGDGTAVAFHCPWSASTAGAPTGYGTVNIPVNATIRYATDIDGDGVRDDVRWMILVHWDLGGNNPNCMFGGARAAWNRQVSPPPAAATFNDVATSHPQFSFVEALAASGITAGCGGGSFCPGAPLTRGQMAVFLAKTLGLHWGTPFVVH